MNADGFAEWLRRQGYRVVRTASSYWYNAAPGVFQAFPYHWVITPSDAEIRNLMWRHGALAVRYSAPMAFSRGVVSYHVVLHPPYSLDMLKSQARNGVKTGMGHFKIEQISFERLATEGWLLQQDTLDRQDRLRSMTREGWERLCRAACGLEGFEAWAATSNGELAAAIIAARLGPVFSVPFALSHRRFLGEHVNNALFYCASQELLQREGIEGLFFTVQSLDAPANVDEFKFRMGLQPTLVRQCVDFHPLSRPFTGPLVHGWTRRLLQRDPSNPLITKAEGMLRFHQEGRKPIEEQAWPERLQAERARLAAPPAVLSKGKGFQVCPATPFDVPALVDLHHACFSKEENIPVLLGRRFLQAVYRWFVRSPETFVLVARQGDRIIGLTAVCDRSYNLPMVKACRRELVAGFLRHPWAAVDRRLIRRLGWSLFLRRRDRGPEERVAQIAYTAVDAAFQGQEVGRALKEASIRMCRERGSVAVTTGVVRTNLRARRLNELAGFVEVPSGYSRKLVHLRLDLGDAQVASPEPPALVETLSPIGEEPASRAARNEPDPAVPTARRRRA
jgi:ribosomal protein S18 acetylase RimI-like enzyme